MKDLKLVICDIDSTLVDSKRNLMPTTRENDREITMKMEFILELPQVDL